MTTLDEARTFARERRRVGFETPAAPASPAAVAEIEKIVEKAARQAAEDFARRVAETTSTGGDDLRKRLSDLGGRVGAEIAGRLRESLAAGERERAERAERAEHERAERAAGAELGRRVGARLVEAAAALKKAHAAAAGTGALGIVDAFQESDRLKALQKATPGYVSGATVARAEQSAEFLAALGAVKATPSEAHTAADRALERPASAAGADEMAAAAAQAAAGAPAWLDRLHGESVAQLVKHAPRRRIA